MRGVEQEGREAKRRAWGWLEGCTQSAVMFGLLKSAYKDFNEDDAPVRAAALAYYTVFALPPLLILLIIVAGAVWDVQDVERALEGQFASLVGDDGGRAIHDMIARADRPGSDNVLASLLGIAALLFGATGAFLQLQDALNKAWEVAPDPRQGGIRRFMLKRVVSLGMILGVAFLLIVSLALSAFITLIGESITAIPESVLHATNFVVSFGVMTVLFAAIFKILPDAEVAWSDVWIGALVTSVLFVVGKLLIGLYLGNSEPADAFGAASALAIILIWIYYAGMIVLFGAEFTQAWSRRRGSRPPPEPGAKKDKRE